LDFGDDAISVEQLEILRGYKKLQRFKLYGFIGYPDDYISELGEILGGIRTLKSLELKLEGYIDEDEGPSYKTFFEEEIAQLSELEVLKIDFYFDCGEQSSLEKEGSLYCLSNCLAKLPKLKELAFLQECKEFEDEFEHFLDYLEKDCGNLKALEVGTQRGPYSKSLELNRKDMIRFLRITKNMKDLEKLALSNIWIGEEVVMMELLRMMLVMEREGKICLDLNLEIDEKMLAKCVKEIFRKDKIEDSILSGDIKIQKEKNKGYPYFDYKTKPKSCGAGSFI